MSGRTASCVCRVSTARQQRAPSRTHFADEDLTVHVDALPTLKAVVETLVNEIQLFVENHSLVINDTNRTILRIVEEDFPVTRR